MGVLIDLYHGRHTADEELDGWGFDGPILGPFAHFHVTYGSPVVGNTTLLIAKMPVEIPWWDNDSYMPFLGAFYGDISITSEEALKNNKALKLRWERTQKIFKLTNNDFGQYINDPEEWIKHYAILKMKGDL